jgi:hypothetical protein
MTNEQLDLCDHLQTIYDYEITCGNIIQRIDRKLWSKIDLIIAFKYPLYIIKPECNIHVNNTLLQRTIKSSNSPLEISFISIDNRQAIAGPADKDILRIELCSELREIYDFEIKHGNKIDRIDRFVWDKIDVCVVFAFPLNIDKQNYDICINKTLLRYVNQDPHYPLETSYTAKEHRQSIAGPNC